MSPVVHMAPGCEETYPKGLYEVDNVPVVDVISTAVRMAEVLASMKEKGIPWISRVGTFNSPPEELLAETEALFPYHGSGEQKY
jgi:hypothetical protein